MHRRIFATIPFLWLLSSGAPVAAHYNMLLPEPASVKRGDTVSLIYQWGHPFEHELFDALPPAALFVIDPDGNKTDLLPRLEKVTAVTAGAKKAVAHRLRFTPEQRGDYVFALSSAAIWMEEEQEFFEDHVKVILHVQAQKDWDAVAQLPLEIVPLTRPYGLQPGMAFQALVQAHAASKQSNPLAGTLVEIEHYNPAPPKALPSDEQITRTVKTDPKGVVTCNLTEPGWWGITAVREGGKKERDGKMFPVKQRATLWVFVDDSLATKPTK